MLADGTLEAAEVEPELELDWPLVELDAMGEDPAVLVELEVAPVDDVEVCDELEAEVVDCEREADELDESEPEELEADDAELPMMVDSVELVREDPEAESALEDDETLLLDA